MKSVAKVKGRAIPWIRGRAPILFKSPTVSNREISEVLPAGCWSDGPAFIVGGGPSLKGFDWKRLDGLRTIGINLAFYYFDPTIVFAMDTRFLYRILSGTYEEKYPGCLEKFNKTPALKCWLLTYSAKLPEDIFIIRVLKNHDFAMKNFSFNMEEGCGHGDNSGFGALNLAFLLGANPIYLLGYDMMRNESESHWHKGYTLPLAQETLDKFKGPFEKWASKIKAAGTRVVNLNLGSRLRCFEFQNVNEVLAGGVV